MSAVLAELTGASRYVCLDKIATGGMAEVHLARREGTAGFRQLVALKWVLPAYADDPTFVRMFLNEARLAASLDHSNLARVIDFGTLSSRYFLAMEYVHGHDLRAVMHQVAKQLPDRRIPLSLAIYVIQSVAAGLHFAHERCGPSGKPLRLVHRDISPSNVLLSFDGEVKLGDFGIAKTTERTQATATSTLRGKLAYMSPEQARSEVLDRRSDVFALGVVLFELTTGFRQFVGDSQYQLLNRVAEGRVTSPREVVPDYPAELESIVMRALAPLPADRFPTALALHEALGLFAHSQGLRTDAGPQLGGLLRELFDDAAYPDVDAEGKDTVELGAPVRPPVATVASDEVRSSSVRRRKRATWSLVGVLGLGLVLGAVLMKTASSDPAPEASEIAPPLQPQPQPAIGLAEPAPEPSPSPAVDAVETKVEPAPVRPKPPKKRRRPAARGASKNAKASQGERLEDWALPPAG